MQAAAIAHDVPARVCAAVFPAGPARAPHETILIDKYKDYSHSEVCVILANQIVETIGKSEEARGLRKRREHYKRKAEHLEEQLVDMK